jgi:SAM-dependent methyltransferase
MNSTTTTTTTSTATTTATATGTARSASTVPPAEPRDLLAEGARVRKLSADVEGVKALVEGTRLVNDAVLTQVLFALWDSGFYEYSLTHPLFEVSRAAQDLGLDEALLRSLLDYLVGRGIIRTVDGQMGLSERGARLSNVLLRGTMNVYVGGWGAQLAKLGPLLRKEIALADFKELRSGRHAVMGTEQMAGIRALPAVSKVLARRKLTGVLHLACRTGRFLIDLARLEPTLGGIGVDRDAERIASAEANASRDGVASRVRFAVGDVARDPLPLDDRIDVVLALYLLHEVGRHGRQKVVELLQHIKSRCPGRQFLFLETLPYIPLTEGSKPPATFSQLDYLVLHRIRGQGLPLPAAEWKSILEEAGLKLVEFQEVFWTGLYLAQL